MSTNRKQPSKVLDRALRVNIILKQFETLNISAAIARDSVFVYRSARGQRSLFPSFIEVVAAFSRFSAADGEINARQARSRKGRREALPGPEKLG